jgi:hypothetical protein
MIGMFYMPTMYSHHRLRILQLLCFLPDLTRTRGRLVYDDWISPSLPQYSVDVELGQQY